ncbi:MAG: transglycosylase domain-containing protein, partial [Actinomycetota bacterium]|nr:transglycosylase domain-containing protein [Actinomycetota bacterium]
MLALISLVFGMLMAVASELPSLENHAKFRAGRNAVLYSARGSEEIAKLTDNANRIVVREGDVSPNIENAVIAVEDQRFFEHEGVDYKGILRAFKEDVVQSAAVQGGSTITQQFVKNAFVAQGNRTVFQKVRESAVAYHLERQWSKHKILTQYLNTVYFGNGAYGIESAMRIYFGQGRTTYGFDERAARIASPAQGALLAGIIASPTQYDPVQNPKAALGRRNLVLRNMLAQGMITRQQYEDATREAIPTEDDITPPEPDSKEPYFSTWLTQQLVDRYGPGRVFGGALKIKTTLDMDLQRAAHRAIDGRLWEGGPGASLVAIENRTGAVKALVGGDNFRRKPFNIATNGHRQPGSAIKPFILLEALRRGISPGRTFSSRKKTFPIRGGGPDFVVENYEERYSGVTTLANATAQSDNSVYAELGLELGTRRVARLANRMGIRTPLSTNPAMVLGGLREGVTPLEMAYAYSTIANRGERRSGTLAPSQLTPTAIQEVEGAGIEDRNEPVRTRVFSRDVGEQARTLLQGVVQRGTGRSAQIPGHFLAGKTGTTENYGDAWFVGFNEKYTVAVWVGYPDRVRYMRTEFHGEPVAGGTFPAEIWRAFMMVAIALEEKRNPDKAKTAPLLPGP